MVYYSRFNSKTVKVQAEDNINGFEIKQLYFALRMVYPSSLFQAA